MVNKIFVVLLITCVSINCFSQKSGNEDSDIINHYSNQMGNPAVDGKMIERSDTLLLKVTSAGVANFKRENEQQILRQINKEWFVVHMPGVSVKNKKYVEKIFVASNNWKLSASLLRLNNFNADSAYTFLIKVTDSAAFMSQLKVQNTNVRLLGSYHSTYLSLIAKPSMINVLLALNEVLFIDAKKHSPKEEAPVNDYDNSVNAINLFFSRYPTIKGDGLTVSVKENLIDTTDIDFKGRYIPSGISSALVTSHANTMATLIAGGGNSFQTAKGIASGSLLSSSNFANLLPDENSYFNQYKISVQNNSYGVGVEDFYGSDAAAYDQSTIDNPSLLYVFSAGNSGNLNATSGVYDSTNGLANLTGSFKQAKNIITVGSVDSIFNVPLLSSKGPAYDGRIKPELVAYGNDGSSGAAAITSGTLLAIQSAYANVHHDSLPQNALAKAIVINSAEDVFNPGPDFYSGYGNVNTNNATTDALSNRYFSGSVTQGQIHDFNLRIPANVSNLKVTLVWNDPAAQTNAFTALINDLDLTIENPGTHTIWQPWILNAGADSSTLLSDAIRGRDSLNNIEQITFSNPPAGDYIIHVKGYNIASASQSFYVVYRFDTANTFTFISPVINSHFTAGGNSIFRWSSSYDVATPKATLEYSMDKGATWQLISDTIDVSKKYFKWIALDTNIIAIARMTINSNTYYSDTFDISAQIYPLVGFYCTDSALIYWPRQAGTNAYQLYILGDKYLQPFTVTTDTSVILKKQNGLYVAVAPVFAGHAGLTSYAYDYSLQGVGCYISNFLADPDGSNALLNLSLGTTFNVKQVVFQQLVSGVWKALTQIDAVTDININYESPLSQGTNYYRAVLTLTNGSTIISNQAYVYYFKNADYIITPNPVVRKEGFSVLSNAVSSNKLVLFDMLGRRMLNAIISQQSQLISTTQLARGIYVVMIFDDSNKMVFKTKIIID